MDDFAHAKPNPKCKIVRTGQLVGFYFSVDYPFIRRSQIRGSRDFTTSFKLIIFEQPSLTGAPEGGRRTTRLANCAAGEGGDARWQRGGLQQPAVAELPS